MGPSERTGAGLRAALGAQVTLPLFVAPMFLISGPDLIIAASRAGALSAFPSINARTSEDLAAWLARISDETADGAPWGVNLIVHSSNARLDADLAATVAAKAPIVVASVGPPDKVAGPVHEYGGLVFSDVATVRHARKAVAAGADGLILLTAGAGGNTGWLNPFAFVAEVRAFFDGPIAVAGAIGSGDALFALEVLDVDLGYVGTPFIATHESLAQPAHKDMVVKTGADGVALSDLVTGIPANFARESLIAEGIITADGEALHTGALDISSWKTVWSMGHGCGATTDLHAAVDLIETYRAQWLKAAQIARGRPAQ